jgi:pyrroline-5-carboxylate reductase
LTSEQIPTITFIGGGNMARSLVGGLIRAGTPPEDIRVSEPAAAQRALLEPLGVKLVTDNRAACRGADVIVLAVKPQVLQAVLGELDQLHPAQLVISIAAGVPLAAIERHAARGQPIVRCMPNTPALLGVGITALYANRHTDDARRAQAAAVLAAAGATVWVNDETLLDAVTAVSGSGPAYFFYLMEAMIDAGEHLGLDPDTATHAAYPGNGLRRRADGSGAYPAAGLPARQRHVSRRHHRARSLHPRRRRHPRRHRPRAGRCGRTLTGAGQGIR